MAAVNKHGHALRHAAEECKRDREIVSVALRTSPGSIEYAGDELKLDSNFAPEAKQDRYILKISMLSGIYTVVLARGSESVENILRRCCVSLDVTRTGTEAFVHGTEVVPDTAAVIAWPGLRPQGEVSEYQLIV
eukprot:1834274-Amphidinium_carterae.1